MKTILIFLSCILFSLNLNAQVLDSLGCSGILGDVKYSILESDDFITENGSCWVLLDGANIAGSTLAISYGINILPDARGFFIRSYDDRTTGRVDVDRVFGEAIGTTQADEFKSHTHNTITRSWGGSTSNNRKVARGIDNAAQEIFPTESAGGNETRPVNLTLYTYIRID